MEPINHYSLEEFAARHRADFDLHEPRPELWAALETQLEANAAPGALGQPRMSIAAAEASAPTGAGRPVAAPPRPVLRAQRRRWQVLEVACALLVLVGAATLGELWKTHRPAVAAAVRTAAATRQAADAALYLGADTTVLPASQGGPNGNARLDTAVQGMERYYVAQLTDRQAQLSHFAPDTQAEWTQELVSLDSSYQQLKRELPRHPQPEVVLTAMNRNLQIRLDILDRQLELRGADDLAETPSTMGSEFALADSRVAAAEQQHHAH